MNEMSARHRTVTVAVDTEMPISTAVMAEPRGIGGSSASLGALTMDLLASDIATVIRTVAPTGRAFAIVGHAFGQRVARLTATNDPDVVDNVILLAPGGMIEPEPTNAAALLLAFDRSLDDDTRLAAIRTAFFAPGNDPSPWRGGWHPLVAYLQGEAKNTIATSAWWTAGRCPVLVVQPAQDVIAVPANADSLLAAIGERAELVTIENAGQETGIAINVADATTQA